MLTIRQAADILNVSPGLVYALCAGGKLEHERYGLGRGTIRIREESLAQFQMQSKHACALPQPATSGVFRHLNGQRLAEAWKNQTAM